MRFLKSRKFKAILLVIFFLLLYFRHNYSVNQSFYELDYEKTEISSLLKKEELTEDDYYTIFQNTGVSPKEAKELVAGGNVKILERLNDLYFEKPIMEKEFIAYPVTARERNTGQTPPIVNLRKGDILVTFNTYTLGWRHGHCGMVVDEEKGIMLEHMAIGYKSCFTYVSGWEKYPSFVVLRYPDEKVAQDAVNYALKHLVGVDYNILAGVIKKDKADEKIPSSSHCSHLIWQAYKTSGVDIDQTGGVFIPPKNLAMSDKLEVIQIYGLNPENYKDRIAK